MPDWRNFGVMLRLLLGGNLVAGCMALAAQPNPVAWWPRFLEMAAFVEPLILLTLGLLALGRDLLWRLPLRLAQALVLLAVQGLSVSMLSLAAMSYLLPQPAWTQSLVLCALATIVLLAYFELRARASPPVHDQTRLAALNARIRPHFLFNTLNSVLSLIRARPQQAEAALESLSDLFRAAMRDPQEKVSLAEEIELAQHYLDLEKLRLGERLAVDWQIEPDSGALPIPPLILQPLLENAVYHGIEPSATGGCIRVRIGRHREALRIVIANPLADASCHGVGNQMALDNIRERLALYYDLEASMARSVKDGNYEVRIDLPWPKP